MPSRFRLLLLGRGRVDDLFTGQRVLDCAQNAARGIRRLGNRVHFPCLLGHHGVQQPLGTAEEVGRLMRSIQDLHVGDVTALHGDLYFDRSAVAARRAGVDAVLIRQRGKKVLFFLFCGRRFRFFARSFDHGAQTLGHFGQNGAGAGQRDQDDCGDHRSRDQLHQRPQLGPESSFPHEFPSSDMENKVTPAGATLW